MKHWIIFDLDGTLADIEDRRKFSDLGDGKIEWSKFFDPNNIKMDKPKHDVINILKTFSKDGFSIAIFSGRSKDTEQETIKWLESNNIKWDILQMRPMSRAFKFMPDDKLKQMWLDEIFPDKEDIMAVFDDRDKVVNMWRSNGLTCCQVAPGNF